jgi:hypothetical protein
LLRVARPSPFVAALTLAALLCSAEARADESAPLHRRTPGMFATGLVMIGVGATGFLVGTVVAVAGASNAFPYSSSGGSEAMAVGGAIMAVGGGVALVGIPLAVIGGHRVRDEQVSLALGPSSVSLRLTF